MRTREALKILSLVTLLIFVLALAFEAHARGGGGGGRGGGGAYAVGTMINAANYSALPCTPTTVVANGITYSQCGSTWYQPTYSGGDVTYVVANPPPGY